MIPIGKTFYKKIHRFLLNLGYKVNPWFLTEIILRAILIIVLYGTAGI